MLLSNEQFLLEKSLKQFNLQTYSEPLMKYLLLLQKWNKAYNLTAIRDLKTMISKHILDSVAITSWIHGTHIIDVGSGAGLPGIPLAVCMPDKTFTLLDSNGKKTRFLAEVKRQLKLDNVEVVQFRVEDYRPTQAFDTVLSRAFSTIQHMINWTEHLVAAKGIWLAMKGLYPENELTAVDYPFKVERYHVAEIDGERCCVIINNQ